MVFSVNADYYYKKALNFGEIEPPVCHYFLQYPKLNQYYIIPYSDQRVPNSNPYSSGWYGKTLRLVV